MKESAYINRKVNMAPQEEIAERERQYRLYDYYGIPYLMLDDTVEYEREHKNNRGKSYAMK